MSRRQILPAPLSNQLSSRVPLPLPVTPKFQVQNPLSGFAPKQTKESSAWRATYIVLQMLKVLEFFSNSSATYTCWIKLHPATKDHALSEYIWEDTPYISKNLTIARTTEWVDISFTYSKWIDLILKQVNTYMYIFFVSSPSRKKQVTSEVYVRRLKWFDKTNPVFG